MGIYGYIGEKKAYDNWNEVIEYDGKSLLNFKQSKRSNTYQDELQIGQIGYPRYNDSMGAGFSAQSQLVNPNSSTRFDSTSFRVHEPLISNSHHAQGMRNDNSVGLAQGFKLLALPCSHLVSILLMTGPTTETKELMNTLLRKRFAYEVMRCLRMKICNSCFDSLAWWGMAL
ncbi:hypothetical protein RCOM_0445820 [Ricinus communis]|uniref:Uncharacterized protein n=1 Tax=Ricinus communis TaxID=3988 RepID=B9T1S7_RICCO|nr:hypothetical protein RCOM_0445820 [Ricinus communis]